jgi:hypothetical protein
MVLLQPQINQTAAQGFFLIGTWVKFGKSLPQKTPASAKVARNAVQPHTPPPTQLLVFLLWWREN